MLFFLHETLLKPIAWDRDSETLYSSLLLCLLFYVHALRRPSVCLSVMCCACVCEAGRCRDAHTHANTHVLYLHSRFYTACFNVVNTQTSQTFIQLTLMFKACYVKSFWCFTHRKLLIWKHFFVTFLIFIIWQVVHPKNKEMSFTSRHFKCLWWFFLMNAKGAFWLFAQFFHIY